MNRTIYLLEEDISFGTTPGTIKVEEGSLDFSKYTLEFKRY